MLIELPLIFHNQMVTECFSREMPSLLPGPGRALLKASHTATLPYGQGELRVEAGARVFASLDCAASLFQAAECDPAAEDQLVSTPE